MLVPIFRLKKWSVIVLVTLTMILASQFATPIAAQSSNTVGTLEDSLRNSSWSGTYQLSRATHTTSLTVESINAGFIGGTIIHQQIAPSQEAFLRVKVAGDILPQYYVDVNRNSRFEWIDEDQLTLSDLESLDVRNERLLIRLKRFRGMEFRNSTGTSWDQNREYRLLLVDGQLSGSVGIPPKKYGQGDGTSENGTLVMSRMR